MDWLKMFEALAPILSQSAQNRAEGKILEGNLAQNQNQNATSRYQALVNASRLQNIEQPAANMSQAGRGALMSTWQPMSITPGSVPAGSRTSGAVMPSISGGPSITPEMRQTGDSVMKQALQRQLGGNQINTSLFPSDEQLGLNALPKQGVLDSILQYGSMGTSILGGLSKLGLLGSGGGGVSAIGANGVPVGGTVLAPETMPAGGSGASFLDKLKFFGGGGADGGPSRSPYFDMLMKQQLNDFGLGPDSSANELALNPDAYPSRRDFSKAQRSTRRAR